LSVTDASATDVSATLDPTGSSGDAPATSSSASDPTVDPDSSSGSDPQTTSGASSSGKVSSSEGSSSGGELCGNGAIDAGEDCDGDDLGGADCVGQGFDDGTLACDACAFDTAACVDFSCGNDDIEGKELCDGIDLGGATCVTEGFLAGSLGCLANCSDYDTSACLVSLCGNGAIEVGEVCDGAALGGQSCANLGYDGGTLVCADDCSTVETAACFACGDGVANGNEDCDGGDLDGATCGGLGYDSGTPSCAANCTVSPAGCFSAATSVFCAVSGAPIGPATGTLTQSNIAVAGLVGAVVDVDVSLAGTHTWIGDLQLDVRYVPVNLSVNLADAQCGSADDFDATFDEDAVALPVCGVPAFSGDLIPLGNLDAYVGVAGSGNGTWELSVLDQAAGDGGVLDQWCVEITNLVPA
jgi:subtilisin-like proprotein convertase family protein